MLQSHDEQNIILVTYKDLKKALNKVSWKYFDHKMALESNFKFYFFQCFSDLYLQQTKDQQHRLQLWLFIVQEFWIIIDDSSTRDDSHRHHYESSKKKKIYENLDFRHFWWFLRLLLHSAQSFISSSWYESLLWVIADRIRLRITYVGQSSLANHRLPINPHIMPIIQSSSVRASLTPSWHLRVGAREQHMMTHQTMSHLNDELQQPIRRRSLPSTPIYWFVNIYVN